MQQLRGERGRCRRLSPHSTGSEIHADDAGGRRMSRTIASRAFSAALAAPCRLAGGENHGRHPSVTLSESRCRAPALIVCDASSIIGTVIRLGVPRRALHIACQANTSPCRNRPGTNWSRHCIALDLLALSMPTSAKQCLNSSARRKFGSGHSNTSKTAATPRMTSILSWQWPQMHRLSSVTTTCRSCIHVAQSASRGLQEIHIVR